MDAADDDGAALRVRIAQNQTEVKQVSYASNNVKIVPVVPVIDF
jgi:hypothetical protein